MKNLFITLTLIFSTALFNFSSAQTVMQLDRMDCNGVKHDLFSDLDSGKAVVLFFWMPNCSSCPPPAKKILAMMNNMTKKYPGKVVGYSLPFNNSTNCAASNSWVSTNSLAPFIPYDSGATLVAHYGGFGMPTVVLLGGMAAKRRVLFSTLSFTTTDTTIMRDSMMALFTPKTSSILELNHSNIKSVSIYPNPVTDIVNISIQVIEESNIKIDVLNITGKIVSTIYDEKSNLGMINKTYNTSSLIDGIYTIRINANGNITNTKINVNH